MNNKSILILEDDLRTLSAILGQLADLEECGSFSFALTILTDYTQVESYINTNPQATFDIILLDRDCRLGGSFHVLDIEKFGVDKVIAISSVPEYNDQLRQRGVSKIILKNYANIDEFSKKVASAIEEVAG